LGPTVAVDSRNWGQPKGSPLHLKSLMKSRNSKTVWPLSLLSAALFLCILSVGSWSQQAKPGNPANHTRTRRGRYIVEDVAMCGTCHTPRNSSGDLDRAHWLVGASLWLLPAHPTSDWPLRAPRIAGSPPASDEELIGLLTTGIWKDGSHLHAPMPRFRMSRGDAESVVAYLRSLSAQPGD